MKPASLTSALLVRKGNAAPAPAAHPRIGGLDSAPETTAPRVHAYLEAVGARPADNKPRTEAPPIKLSVRLDRARHLRLKLAAAHVGLSVQALVQVALDRHLDEIGACTLAGACACVAEPPGGSA